MKRIFIAVFIFISLSSIAQLPQTLLLDANKLQEIKKKSATGDLAISVSLDSLQKAAEELLNMQLLSVMDKAFTPPSGNKHDYMSQAPYFWYDSSKPNGLPYMRRDGVRNPEISKITDRTYIGRLESAARTLSLAWYFTGKEKYAKKAAELLQHWFFNEAAKMNPNLQYAQAVPGVNSGRGIGIIETRALCGIADAAQLLKGSAAWTGADEKSLQQWYTQYLNWLLTSKNGNDEHAAKNNHGTWFYVQAIDFALFTGDIKKAKQLAEESKKRIDSQITAEGKMPLELERTNALGYSTFNLRAWFDLATLAQKAGVDLWHYKNPSGAGLQTALDWLIPYALGKKPWTYQQISKYNQDEIVPVIRKAAEVYKQKEYVELLKGEDGLMSF